MALTGRQTLGYFGLLLAGSACGALMLLLAGQFPGAFGGQEFPLWVGCLLLVVVLGQVIRLRRR